MDKKTELLNKIKDMSVEEGNYKISNIFIISAVILIFILIFARPSVNIDLSNNKATAGISNN